MKKALLLAAALFFGPIMTAAAQSPPMSPTVDFSTSIYSAWENWAAVEITVYLTGDAGQNTVTVDFATSDGNATEGADYVGKTGTLTFPPGTYSQSFWITVKTDLESESSETIILTLSNAVNANIGWNSPATLYLFDVAPPAVQFSTSNYSQWENMLSVDIEVTVFGDVGNNTVKVNFATANGTATAGDDYDSTSGYLEFPPGTYSKTFTITIKKDLVSDPNESVILSLNTPINAVLGTQVTATLTIHDSPPPTVQFSTSNYYQWENMLAVDIEVTVSGDVGSNTVKVNFATANGTATAGDDYVSTSGYLEFPPGTYSKTFTITIKKDLVSDPDENVLLSLDTPINAVLGMQVAATLTIYDNPPPKVQFSSATYQVSENGTSAEITVSIEGDIGNDTVTVKYKTENGTATAGSDYESTTGTISFTSSPSSQIFYVPVKRDVIIEETETVALTLFELANAAQGQNFAAVLNIMDTPPVVTVSSGIDIISAGNKNTGPHQTMITATVTDGMDPMNDVLVTFSLSHDATLTPGSATTVGGNATTRLQSSLTSTEKEPTKEEETKHNVTITASVGGGSGVENSCVVEFKTTVTLEVSHPEIVKDEISSLTVTVKSKDTVVPGHYIEWKAKIRDLAGTVVYDGFAPLPAGWGTLGPMTTTTNDYGVCLCSYTAGANLGEVEISAHDSDTRGCVNINDKIKDEKKIKVVVKPQSDFFKNKFKDWSDAVYSKDWDKVKVLYRNDHSTLLPTVDNRVFVGRAGIETYFNAFLALGAEEGKGPKGTLTEGFFEWEDGPTPLRHSPVTTYSTTRSQARILNCCRRDLPMSTRTTASTGKSSIIIRRLSHFIQIGSSVCRAMR